MSDSLISVEILEEILKRGGYRSVAPELELVIGDEWVYVGESGGLTWLKTPVYRGFITYTQFNEVVTVFQQIAGLRAAQMKQSGLTLASPMVGKIQ